MFRRRRSLDGGDDITIGSAASVSDRIIGRMKRNLSFGNKNNLSSAGSVSSGKSAGRFGRKKKQIYRLEGDWESVQSNGSRKSSKSMPSSRSAKNRFRNSIINDSCASVTTMEEMDSNESMTLKGISMGRRRVPSAPVRQSSMEEEEGERRLVDEPIEMSLNELRSMSESELEQAMINAGVPPEDIFQAKDSVMKRDVDADAADEKRRGSLVALFVNSGHVRLIQTDRRSTLSSINNSSIKSSVDTDATTSSRQKKSNAPMDTSDATLLETKPLSRKSKLEKIAELQGEKSTLKKENKALKKTMKSLLIQLSESSKERKALKKEIESNARETCESHTVEDLTKGSIHSVDPDTSIATDNDSKVVRRKDNGSQRSRDVSVKEYNALKKVIKKQRQEHENTEFRLKAEIEILTKEVDGLQRELSLSLESLDDAEKRLAESDQTVSKLKRKMRTTLSKLRALTEEADARDNLIDTFTKILVEKNGFENAEAAVVGGKCKVAPTKLIQTGS